MKLSAFFFFIIFFQYPVSGYSQNDSITLNLKNVSVEEVINSIEMLTDYKFFMDTKEVNLERKISLQVKSELISIVLKKIIL